MRFNDKIQAINGTVPILYYPILISIYYKSKAIILTQALIISQFKNCSTA